MRDAKLSNIVSPFLFKSTVSIKKSAARFARVSAQRRIIFHLPRENAPTEVARFITRYATSRRIPIKLNCQARLGSPLARLSANARAKCSNRFKACPRRRRGVRFIPFCTMSALCPQDNNTEEPTPIVACRPPPPSHLSLISVPRGYQFKINCKTREEPEELPVPSDL